MTPTFKILVVDDEESIRSVLKDYLEITNKTYTVLTCRDGLEALEVLQKEKIDCCFADLSMPRMDGLELTERIHGYDSTIPVIVMTGYPSMDKAITTLRNGVSDFLIKPIRMEMLPIAIDKALREKALFVENLLLKEEAKGKEKLLNINRELEGKINELETINLILRRLEQPTSSKDFFSTLVNLSGQVTRCDEAHFCILDQEMRTPAVITSFVREANDVKNQVECLGEDIIKTMVDDGMPLIMKGGRGKGNVIAMPFKIRGRVFGSLVLSSREGKPDFSEKDLYFLNFLAEKASSLIENLALYENIYENLFATLYAFVETIEARDVYTKQHSARVTAYAVTMAKKMECSEEEIHILNVSGYLHDIGKIGVPDQILLKPGKLTDEEYQVIKKHPTIGSNIIGHFHMWAEEQEIIKCHHERWDGRGYPYGFKGEEIPFLSRLVSLADVYDALTSDRSYRKKLSEDVALGIIKEGSATQFDPEIVKVFFSLCREGKMNLNETGERDGFQRQKLGAGENDKE